MITNYIINKSRFEEIIACLTGIKSLKLTSTSITGSSAFCTNSSLHANLTEHMLGCNDKIVVCLVSWDTVLVINNCWNIAIYFDC